GSGTGARLKVINGLKGPKIEIQMRMDIDAARQNKQATGIMNRNIVPNLNRFSNRIDVPIAN
ncbi:MAG: hypothetical protein HQ492_06700, partial [Woeseiaceae bacterium]|nr:hypothetical protein [Woeseiaceae bacterium]